MVRRARERFRHPGPGDVHRPIVDGVGDIDPDFGKEFQRDEGETGSVDGLTARSTIENSPGPPVDESPSTDEPAAADEAVSSYRLPDLAPNPLPRFWKQFGRLRRTIVAVFVLLVIQFGGFAVDWLEGRVSTEDLQPGDCLLFPTGKDADSGFQVYDLQAVPCKEPHDMEVFETWDYSPPSFPGDNALGSYVSEVCQRRFESYTGVPYPNDVRFDFLPFTPTEESWKRGNHTANCFLVTIDGSQMVGQQRGRGLWDGIGSLQTGWCYDIVDTALFMGFLKVDCYKPHDIEFIGYVDVPSESADTYPGKVFLEEFAARTCSEESESYLGGQWEPGLPGFGWFYPQPDQWEDFPHQIHCMLVGETKLDQPYQSET